MRNYSLSFISNDDLYNHTKDTVKKYRFQVDLAKFNKNLIDPIKLTFDSKVYGRDIQSVIESYKVEKKENTAKQMSLFESKSGYKIKTLNKKSSGCKKPHR